MYLSHLALNDFRNYREAICEFSPGANVLVGANGQGKTNVVEAIAYLATFTSHRVAADAALVRAGTPGAVVRAKTQVGSRSLLLELEIIAGKANRARLNRAPVRPRELLGIVRVVMFAPEDLALVKGDPAERRRFLDELVVTRTPRLAGVKADYDKTLRQRSALLKQSGGSRHADPMVLSTLDVWDAQLAAAGAELMKARADVVRDIAPHVDRAYREVADGDGPATLELATSLAKEEERHELALPETGAEEIAGLRTRLEAALRAVRTRELDRGVTLVGPHRDDLLLGIGELPAKGYASHGESWSLALALKLASFRLLIEDDPDSGSPILILDDVFAELDARRRARLAEVVAAADQSFITAAVAEDLPEGLSGRRFRVVAGEISAEEEDA